MIIRLNNYKQQKEKVMQINKIVLTILSLLILGFYGCEDTKDDVVDNTIDTPTSYVFESRFNEGESSVSYSGQTVRNMLLTDLKTMTDYPSNESGHAIELSSMMNLYNYDDALDLSTWISTTPNPVETKYTSISTGKNLIGKTDGDVVLGYNQTAEALVTGWMQTIADNCTNADNIGSHLAVTDENGLNLSQMINKTLLGAVPYSQGISNYLAGLEGDDNSEAKGGTSPYTEMEHHWDESFGYFGAARDYNTGYSDDNDRKSGTYYDTDQNGAIDFKSEYIFGLAVNAAKRDAGAPDAMVDFTSAIFNAYLEGRTLITNEATAEEIYAQRTIIANNWEKVIAATVVHYVNDVYTDMTGLLESGSTADPLSADCADLNKHWAEMRGFTIALQYNDFKLISDSQLNTIVDAMGDAPVHPSDGATAFGTYHGVNLATIKSTLQAAYGFSDSNMSGW